MLESPLSSNISVLPFKGSTQKEISIMKLIQKKMSTLLKTVNRGHHHITHHQSHSNKVLCFFMKQNLRFGLVWASFEVYSS